MHIVIYLHTLLFCQPKDENYEGEKFRLFNIRVLISVISLIYFLSIIS